MHLTFKSRQLVTDFCTVHLYQHLFVEFDCDPATLKVNIRETAHFWQRACKNADGTSTSSFYGWTAELHDVEHRVAGSYERCSDGARAEGALIRVQNSDDAAVHAVTARGVQGALQTRILGVLSSPVIRRQLFYFSRHGESDYNVLGRIGGDADLSPRGRRYAELLTKYLTTGGEKGAVRPSSVCIFSSTERVLTRIVFDKNLYHYCLNCEIFPHEMCPMMRTV